MVPQVLLGAVDGVELVAGGLLRLARSVLLTAVSGAADVGAEALDATVSGARRVVSATSQMVGDVAGTARSSVTETVELARHSGRFGFAAGQPRRPPAPMPSRAAESTVTPAGRPDPTPTKQPRSASRSRRRSAAA
jgi:type IV secretory pathway TrbL component